MDVANQRADDQVFIGIWVKSNLAEKVELAREGPRSHFVRDAIAEYCEAKGFPVPKEDRQGADRVKPIVGKPIRLKKLKTP